MIEKNDESRLATHNVNDMNLRALDASKDYLNSLNAIAKAKKKFPITFLPIN
jgi:hypothetical protein